jgi:hypothetical protein
VLGIYTHFSGFALTGWAAGTPEATSRPHLRAAGRAATGLIGAMFVGTYSGQLAQSAWYAVPATIVGGSVIAGDVASRRRERGRADQRMSTSAS